MHLLETVQHMTRDEGVRLHHHQIMARRFFREGHEHARIGAEQAVLLDKRRLLGPSRDHGVADQMVTAIEPIVVAPFKLVTGLAERDIDEFQQRALGLQFR